MRIIRKLLHLLCLSMQHQAQAPQPAPVKEITREYHSFTKDLEFTLEKTF